MSRAKRKTARTSSQESNNKVFSPPPNNAPLKPLNPLQEQYISYCKHKPIVIATGFQGTSKTYIPTRVAINKLLAHHIDKIVVVRPNVSDSKSLGYFSGDAIEKLKNWIKPVLSIFDEFLGAEYTDYLLKMGRIEGVPLETIKGMSFKRSFIIIDEAEDLTEKEFIKCVTRIGEQSTMVFCGDIMQTDLKSGNGLSLGKSIAEEAGHLNWGQVDFNRPSDIVRSGTAREVILELRRRGYMQ